MILPDKDTGEAVPVGDVWFMPAEAGTEICNAATGERVVVAPGQAVGWGVLYLERAEYYATKAEVLRLWDRLLGYWSASDARLWLSSPQPLLDGAVPADVVAKGEIARLHGLIDALDEGTYL